MSESSLGVKRDVGGIEEPPFRDDWGNAKDTKPSSLSPNSILLRLLLSLSLRPISRRSTIAPEPLGARLKS